jgi:tetratricopeptide (TPR) repeat protein
VIVHALSPLSRWRSSAAPLPSAPYSKRFLPHAVVAPLVAAPGISSGQQPDESSWLGRRVVQKSSDFALRIENQIVDRRRFMLFYRVERVDGSRLWLNDEGKGASGWVNADETGPFEGAIGFFTERIRANPQDAFAYVMRAAIYQERKQLDSALLDYAEAIKLDPNHAWVYNNRGIAWTDKKEYDNALADFEAGLRLDPSNAKIFNNRGTIWRFKGVYEAAIADYNDAIRLQADYGFAHYNRGLAWADMGDYAKAIADFDEAVRIVPRDAQAFDQRGLAWLHLDRMEKALADFDEALRIDPKLARAYHHRGLAHAAQGKYAEAIADQTRALEIDSTAAEVLYRRGLARRETKQYAEAITDFESAVRADPRFDEAFIAHAWLRLTCPDPAFRDAIVAVESAINACKLSDWKDAYALSTLAAAYTAAKDFASAAHWQKAAAEIAAAAKGDRKGTLVTRSKERKRRKPTNAKRRLTTARIPRICFWCRSLPVGSPYRLGMSTRASTHLHPLSSPSREKSDRRQRSLRYSRYCRSRH